MTNGSKEIIDYNDDRVIITVSIHPFFINKIKLQKRKNIFYNLLAVPYIFDKIKEIYNSLEIDEITVIRKPPDFTFIYEYTKEQKEWIIENDPNKIKINNLYSAKWWFDDNSEESQPLYSVMEFNQNKYLNFQNLYCLNNSLNISPSGRYKYTCYNSKESLKSIYFNPIIYDPQIIQCKYKFCNCAGRLNILKTQNEKEAKKYLEFIKNGK